MTDIPRRLGNAPDSPVDRAIDRAVREMMHVDPRSGFRRRVLSRLDSEPVRSSMFSRLALAGAAVALLIVAFMVMVPDRGSELPPPVVQRETQPVRTTPQLAAPSKTGPARGPEQRTSTVTRERIQMPRVTNVFRNTNGTAAAASVEPEAAWPSPAPQSRADAPDAPAPIVVPALELAPIVIAPLNPRGPGGL